VYGLIIMAECAQYVGGRRHTRKTKTHPRKSVPTQTRTKRSFEFLLIRGGCELLSGITKSRAAAARR
jgi:hypothetical protein